MRVEIAKKIKDFKYIFQGSFFHIDNSNSSHVSQIEKSIKDNYNADKIQITINI
jgi:hypothetical protein